MFDMQIPKKLRDCHLKDSRQCRYKQQADSNGCGLVKANITGVRRRMLPIS
jgi:hypothetical protein